MNRIYKTIWSKVRNCYVVVSEIAKSHTKSPSGGVVGAVNLENSINLHLHRGTCEACIPTGVVSGTFASDCVPVPDVRPFKITVAAIVKNEAENVPTWVQAARSCADEIVVVDTGSVDGTVERFADYGIKCNHYDWNDDFASAKNYMISLCHGDWIVLLDGDEWFREGCNVRKAIAKHHANPITKAIIADWICLDKDRNNAVMFSGGAVRAFRNSPEIRYFRKVHENLTIGYENFVFEPDFKMYHTGYSGSVNRSKHERNLRIMRTMFDFDNGIVEFPTDWRYIEDTYAGLGQFDKALWAADKMISYGVQEYSAAAWITKFNVLFALKTPLAEMWKQFEYCFRTVPSVSGFRFLASIYYFRNGQIEAGLDNYIEGLRMLMEPQDRVAQEHTYWRMYLPEASALASAVYLQSEQVEASLYACKVSEQYCGKTQWTDMALADVRRVMNTEEVSVNIIERLLPVLNFSKKAVLSTALVSSLTVGMVNPVFAANTDGYAAGGGSVCTYAGRGVAIGNCSESTQVASIAIGNYARADEASSVAIGNMAVAYNSGDTGSQVAIGAGAYANGNGSIALGGSSVALCDNVVSFGHLTGNPQGSSPSFTYDSDLYRRLINVADGVDDHDVVTVGQLNTALANAGGGGGSIPYIGICSATGFNNETGGGALGPDSIAIGACASTATTACNSISIGKNARNVWANSIAMGLDSNVTMSNSIAIGGCSSNTSSNAIAIGKGVSNDGANSIVIGNGACNAGQENNVTVVGTVSCNLRSTFTTNIGYGSTTGVTTQFTRNLTSVGSCNVVSKDYATVLGSCSTVSACCAIGLGYNVSVSGVCSIALGANTGVSGTCSVVIGSDSYTSEDNVVSFGGDYLKRRLTNVADGVNDNDVVTVGQLNDALASAGSGASSLPNTLALGTCGTTAACASGTNALAIGEGAVASGDKAISIGTGNQVRGDNSGAIGNPNIVDANNSYTVGNNSTISANVDGAFVLGNNVTVNNGTLLANWNSLTDEQKSDITGEGVVALGNNVSVSLCNKVNSSRSSDSVGSPKIQHVVAVGDSAIVGEENGVAIGYQSEARALNALASGTCAKALSEGATALGQGSVVHENSSFAIAVGYEAEATGEGANAFGDNANAGDKFATAFGRATNAACEASTAIGNEAVTTGKRAVAIGNESVASAEGATSIGNSSNAVTRNAVSIGNQAVANGEGVGVVAIGNGAQVGTSTSGKGSSTAVGALANVQSYYSTALGAQTSVTANNSVALGAGSVASQANAVSVGAGTATDPYPATRKIINVTDGTANTDVSTVGQTGRNLALSGSTLSLKNANGTVLDSVTLPSVPTYTAGNGLVLDANNEFTVKAGTNVTVDANGINVAGNGTVVSGNTGLISGGTLFTEGRVASNGNYVQANNTIAQNLGALDTQVKANADAIDVNRTKYYGVNAQFEEWTDSNAEGLKTKYNVETQEEYENLVVNGFNIHGEGATGENAIAIGKQASASSYDSIALGTNASAFTDGIAIGLNSSTELSSGIAIGLEASSKGGASISIGDHSASTGSDSIAMGNDANAIGNQSVSIGFASQTTNLDDIAIGYLAKTEGTGYSNIAIGRWSNVANGEYNIAIGDNSLASGDYEAIAIGKSAKATAAISNAFGFNSVATGEHSSAIGAQAIASCSGSVAIGFCSVSSGSNALSIGTFSNATCQYSTVVGYNSKSAGLRTTGIGYNVNVGGTDSVAIGSTTYVSGSDSIALGSNSVAPDDNVLSLGKDAVTTGDNQMPEVTRRILHVTAGVNDTDAVNVGQLNAQKVEYVGVNAVWKDWADLTDAEKTALGVTTEAEYNELVAGSNRSGEGAFSENSIAIGKSALAGKIDNGHDIGGNSIAIGTNAISSNTSTIAIGYNANATNSGAMSIGENSTASSAGSIAVGRLAQSLNDAGIAIGERAKVTANGYYGMAIGQYSEASNSGAAAIGESTVASGRNSIALGYCAKSTGSDSFAGAYSSEASGDYSVAIGSFASAKEVGSVAIGEYASACCAYSVALGNSATASCDDSVSIGSHSHAMGESSVSIGEDSYARKNYSVSVGFAADASEASSTALGNYATAEKIYSTALGYGTHAKGDSSVAVGTNIYSNSQSSVGLGSSVSVSGKEATAIGYSVTAVGDNSLSLGSFVTSNCNGNVAIGSNVSSFDTSSVAIGNCTYSHGNNSIALGANSVSNEDNVLSLGKDAVGTEGQIGYVPEYTRTIQHVTAGVNDTDAVNVKQLNDQKVEYVGINTQWETWSDETADSIKSKYRVETQEEYNALVAGSNRNGEGALGIDSIAFGKNAYASGENALSIGTGGGSSYGSHGESSVSIGNRSFANADCAIAIGKFAIANNESSVAIGSTAYAYGNCSVALGYEAFTNGACSVAIGNHSEIESDAGVALGYHAHVYESSSNAIAVGNTAIASGTDAISIGSSTSTSNGSIALGANTSATATDGIAVGNHVSMSGSHNVGIGNYSNIGGACNIVLGDCAIATDLSNISIGTHAIANSQYNIVLGTDSRTDGMRNVAVGTRSRAVSQDTVALGSNSVATAGYTVSVGHTATDTDNDGNAFGSALKRRIINVADGVDSSDVVTVGQLNAATASLNGTLGNAVMYDTTDKNLATMAGTGGTKLTNLRAGTLTANSTDAVIGSQLYAVKQDIAGFAADINRNKESIRNMNTSVTAALASVSSTSELVDTIDGLKADASLNNLTNAGKQVIANAAANAVQEYLAANPMLGVSRPNMMTSASPASSSNTLNVTDAGNGSLHVGEGSYVNGTSSIAIGVGNQVNANNSGAFGDPSVINADESYVLGNDDTINAGATGSFLVGNDSVSDAKGALLFGSNSTATASADNGVGLGNHTQVKAKNSVALGSESVASEENIISVGNDTLQRRITYVASGRLTEDSTDAVTGSQLYVTNEKVKANEEAIAKKADRDASNIDVSAWAEKLGTGKVTEGDDGLVTGGTVHTAMQEYASNQLVQSDGQTLTIGKNNGASVIDVSNATGSTRVITGVQTNPDDATSVANVGYVNAVGQSITGQMNERFNRVDDRMNKVGAGAAAMAGLVPGSMEEDSKWNLSAAVGNYRNATAGAVGAFYKPTGNVTIALKGAFGNGENMVSGGIGVALNKGDMPGVTKRQLVKTVNTQAEQINAQAQEIRTIKEQQRVEQEQNRAKIAELETIVRQLMAAQQGK